jgi:cell shape-determining protein MreD
MRNWQRITSIIAAVAVVLITDLLIAASIVNAHQTASEKFAGAAATFVISAVVLAIAIGIIRDET